METDLKRSRLFEYCLKTRTERTQGEFASKAILALILLRIVEGASIRLSPQFGAQIQVEERIRVPSPFPFVEGYFCELDKD